MLKNQDTAKQISDLMNDIFQRIDDSTRLVEKTCSAEDFAAYNKAVAQVLGAIVIGVMEPLYDQNPALKPHNWDRPEWKRE